jgi:hypothetical protein
MLFLLTRSDLLLLGNTAPTKSRGLGQAPGIILVDNKGRPSGVTDTSSTGRSNPQRSPLEVVLGEDAEGSWHLPNLEQGSEEDVR